MIKKRFGAVLRYWPALLIILVVISAVSLKAVSSQGSYFDEYSVLSTPSSGLSSQVFKELPLLIYTTHKIQRGETLASIADNYSTDIRSIQSANYNEFVFVPYGGRINVHNRKGLIYRIYSGKESFNSITARMKPEKEELAEFRKKVLIYNNFPIYYMLENHIFDKGEKLIIPDVYVKIDGYRLPVKNFSRISSGYGKRFHPILKRRIFHNGCDIPMPIGSPVYPSRSGRVVFSGYRNGYGNVVEVKHKDGYITRYGHLSNYAVNAGDEVEKSKTLLGKVGSSGLSTGPHLHFEVLTPSGKSINPMQKIGRN